MFSTRMRCRKFLEPDPTHMRGVNAPHSGGHAPPVVYMFGEFTETFRPIVIAAGVGSIPCEMGGGIADGRLCGSSRVLEPPGGSWLLLIEMDIKELHFIMGTMAALLLDLLECDITITIVGGGGLGLQM